MKTTALRKCSALFPSIALMIIALPYATTATSSGSFGVTDPLATGANFNSFSTVGSGGILFQHSRAELVVGAPVAGANQNLQRWKVGTCSSAQDWAVQVAVHFGMLALPAAGDYAVLGLSVGKASDSQDAFGIEMERDNSGSSAPYVARIGSLFKGEARSGTPDTVTDTELLITFNSKQKSLTTYYWGSKNKWVKGKTVKIASGAHNWTMGEADAFNVFLYGCSGNDSGVAAVVNSGDAYFTNFLVTTGATAPATYSRKFAADLPLWDISGTYSGGFIGDLGLDFTIVQDSTGKFKGNGTLNHVDTDTSETGTATVTGAVTNSGTVTRVTMAIAIVGTGTIRSQAINFTKNIKCVGEIDGANKQVVGDSVSESLKYYIPSINKHGGYSGTIKNHPTFPLPVNATGKWNLSVHVVPNGPSYTGTATILTDAGETAVASGKGTYDAFGNSTTMSFKGTGISLNMLFLTTGTNIMPPLKIKGKAFGQSLNEFDP